MRNENRKDQIRIEELEVYAHHGVYPEENEKGQHFYVNATLYTNTRPAGMADDLRLSTNYGEVCQFITEFMQQHTFQLIETVVEWTAYGGVEQENFVNGMFEIRTLLTPEELLRELHKIEASEGRERKIHWGPRTLDLDIIFYDDLIYSSEDLVIPHVDMENRYFVLKPLSELAPNFRHPITHKTVAQMLAELPVDLTEGSEA